MTMKPRDMQRLREFFAKEPDFGEKIPDVSVDGSDLEVRLIPRDNATALVIPYNEDGDQVMLFIDNTTLKRWRAECQEANRLMRRVAHGERNTAHVDHIAVGKGFRRGRA